jgi:hypothetical protein
MVEEANAPVEPAWVVRMREAGFDVRTGTGDLPEEPEVDFSLPRATRIGIRRRVGMIARKLWQRDPHPVGSCFHG